MLIVVYDFGAVRLHLNASVFNEIQPKVVFVSSEYSIKVSG